MNEFSLVQAIDALGQRVVVAVATAAHLGLDTGFGQPLGVANGEILRGPVAVMDQCIGIGPAFVQGLLLRIEHEVRLYGAAHAPAYDLPGKDIDYKGHVQPALPGRDVGQVRDPQLVGPLGLEHPVDAVQRARRRLV